MKPIVNYGLSDSLIDAVRKAVEEAKLHPNQQKLDVHEPEKDELTSQDFKKLRAGKKAKDGIDTKPKLKEEEQIDELSVNKMLKYTDAANKNREVLNKKWDTGTATEKEKNKVLGHEMGVDRAAARVKAKTGKNPHEIGKLSRIKYAITREEEQMDEAPLRAVNALVGYPKLNKKVAAKGTPGSEDERNKAAAGLKRDRSGLGRRAYTGDQHYDVRREEVEQVDEGGMPSSVIKHKQRIKAMSDQEFYQDHKGKSSSDLKSMARRHGYGPDNNVYVDKHKRGQQEGVAEEAEPVVKRSLGKMMEAIMNKEPVGVKIHYTHPKKKPTHVIHFTAKDAHAGEKEMSGQGYKVKKRELVYGKAGA